MDMEPLVHRSEEGEVPLLLREVRVLRFRSLEDVVVPLQPGMTVLTGENDGGKTAILEAIDILLSGRTPRFEDRTHGSGDADEVMVEGTFYSGSDPTTVVRLRAAWVPGGQLRREILDRVHPGFGGRPVDLPINELRARLQELAIPNPGGTAKPPLVQAAETWLTDRPPEEFEDRWRTASTEELQRLPSLTRFESVRAPSPRADIQNVVQREVQRLLSEDRYAAPLADVSRELDRDAQAALDRIRDKIKQYCPDLEDIVITPAVDFTRPRLDLHIRVRRAGEDIDLEAEGEGRRRKLTLAIHEANLDFLESEKPMRCELITYDEPDTHLDYASQRQLFGILDRQACLEHVQVVVATHSLNFIDRVPLDAIVHLRLNDRLRTTVEVVKGTDYAEELAFLRAIGTGLGLRNSVLLDERCLLMVEGKTEEAAIPGLFRTVTDRSLVECGVLLVNTRGSGAILGVMELLRQQWHRKIIVLADSDQRDRVSEWAKQMGLKEGQELFFIGSKEFEDAFEDEVWLRVLQTHFRPRDGTNWTVEDVRKARASAEGMGKALKAAVSRRCGQPVGKPELGYALARSVKTLDEVPTTLRDCLQAALSFAGG